MGTSKASYVVALLLAILPAPVVALLMIILPAPAFAQRFFPDDPIAAMPSPLPVVDPEERDLNALYDFLSNSLRTQPRVACRASAINTLGEVPDSEWFTNRHGKRRMTREELQRGPDKGNVPRPPFTVVGSKTDGVSLGFRMKDAEDRLYFVKTDPLKYPELATGAETIVTKFFYAIGYNVPENYIITAKVSDFKIASDAEMAASRYKPSERMAWADFQDIINRIPVSKQGTFRLIASLAVEGESLGPFRFEGTRRDDPNDIVLHEDRRDLRGLQVFAAWLNHTDAKSLNTLDTLVEQNGVKFIKHYLIDFGAALGSDGDRPKDARFGHKYIFPDGRDALKIPTIGAIPEDWEEINYFDNDSVGRLTSEGFHPEEWRSNYPNQAFLSRRVDDEFWAAKIVTSFTDAEIRSIVETGQYSNPAVADYIARTLMNRRDKIGRTYFSKLLALDGFRFQNGTLQFEDLGIRYSIRPDAKYDIQWFLFDNASQERQAWPAAGESLPRQAMAIDDGAYFGAEIKAAGVSGQSVFVYFRKTGSSFTPVGIERTSKETLAVSECSTTW